MGWGIFLSGETPHGRPIRCGFSRNAMLPIRVSYSALTLSIFLSGSCWAVSFDVTNLVTDDQSAHAAQILDPGLVNAWGVSFGPTSPFWVSANGRRPDDQVDRSYTTEAGKPFVDSKSKTHLTTAYRTTTNNVTAWWDASPI